MSAGLVYSSSRPALTSPSGCINVLKCKRPNPFNNSTLQTEAAEDILFLPNTGNGLILPAALFLFLGF